MCSPKVQARMVVIRVQLMALIIIGFALLHPSSPCAPSSWIPPLLQRQDVPSPEDIATELRKTGHVEPGCECGVGSPKFPRISGGRIALRGEFPWQVALVYRSTRIPFCSGALINNFYVLTAAHCVLNFEKIMSRNVDVLDELKGKSLQVLLNAYQLTPLDWYSLTDLYNRVTLNFWAPDAITEFADYYEGTVRSNVAEVLYHPNFVTGYIDHKFDYDIALLRLETPVNLTAPGAPVPVCLPNSANFVHYKNITAVTAGWGFTNNLNFASGSALLQKIPVPVYSLKKCRSVSGVKVSRRFVCAGYFNKSYDTGKGDSGGPLLVKEGEKVVQIGVVSYGTAENADGAAATVFSRVSEFMPWILQTIQQSSETAGESGSVSWCHDNVWQS